MKIKMIKFNIEAQRQGESLQSQTRQEDAWKIYLVLLSYPNKKEILGSHYQNFLSWTVIMF